MTCQAWNEGWIGQLYGELEPAERVALEAHLAECAECDDRLRELDATRRTLSGAAPAVHRAPRILLARPAARLPVASFAAGVAAATLIFVLGALAGNGWPRQPTAERGPDAAIPAAPAFDTRAALGSVEARLASLELAERSRPPAESEDDHLTREQLLVEFDRLERRMDRRRARDLDYFLRAVSETELRTGAWIDETRSAMQVLALRHDPRLNEH